MQPVKIIDPHLVSSFFDNYTRAYLHTTTELENRSIKIAECSLNIQVMTELEGNFCSVEHLQTQHVSVPAKSRVQYTFPQVSYSSIIENLKLLFYESFQIIETCE